MPEIADRRRLQPWTLLVTACAVLVAGCALALTVWWLVTRERTISTYSVSGSVNAIRLDLGSADVVIAGGGGRDTVDVRRTDEFSFGRRAESQRSARDGTLAIRSRCPRTVFTVCSAAYRLTVPDNVPIVVHTTTGDVHFSGYRGTAQIDTNGGDVDVDSFCGFGLRVRTDSGDVTAGATCAPERLELRSRTGDVLALVPPGRYQVDAESDDGRRSVRGITAAGDAPFQVQVLSGSGDVTVAGTQ
jgi:Putative adhesin